MSHDVRTKSKQTETPQRQVHEARQFDVEGSPTVQGGQIAPIADLTVCRKPLTQVEIDLKRTLQATARGLNPSTQQAMIGTSATQLPNRASHTAEPEDKELEDRTCSCTTQTVVLQGSGWPGRLPCLSPGDPASRACRYIAPFSGVMTRQTKLTRERRKRQAEHNFAPPCTALMCCLTWTEERQEGWTAIHPPINPPRHSGRAPEEIGWRRCALTLSCPLR